MTGSTGQAGGRDWEGGREGGREGEWLERALDVISRLKSVPLLFKNQPLKKEERRVGRFTGNVTGVRRTLVLGRWIHSNVLPKVTSCLCCWSLLSSSALMPAQRYTCPREEHR